MIGQRRNIILNSKGMTLIELLVTLSLVVVVTTILAAILKEGFVSYDRTLTEADTQLSLRHQTNLMIDNIRASKSANIGADHIKLELSMGMDNQIETIIYSVKNGNLVRNMKNRESGVTTEETAIENVADFHVNVTGDSLVEITIEVNESSLYDDSLSKKIVLQAKPRAILLN